MEFLSIFWNFWIFSNFFRIFRIPKDFGVFKCIFSGFPILSDFFEVLECFGIFRNVFEFLTFWNSLVQAGFGNVGFRL